MSTRKPLRVSGLLSSGKIAHNPENSDIVDFHAPTSRAGTEPELLTVTHHDDRKIALALIDDSPYQPRLQYDPLEIDNLAHSMASIGLVAPITVRAKNNRYELIGGHRRVRAARNLGWADITASIAEHSDRDAELLTMANNESRVDLTDYEHGKLYQRAQTAGYATTQTEIANLLGTTQTRVSRCMAMLKLPSYCIDILEDKPNLIGCNCAEVISQLLKAHPNDTDIIQRSVMRLVVEDAEQKSIKPWVEQMIKQRHSIGQQKEAAIITDPAGRAIFTAKFSDREFTVRIKAPEIDIKDVEEIILEALRQQVEKGSV